MYLASRIVLFLSGLLMLVAGGLGIIGALLQRSRTAADGRERE